ncbi:PEHE domain containing protein [Euroglyphus maynei]|uniref:PEHE domain containing protein n=1 Tax=Euroglyphus maynei TaxID=6958 RepID=A0A1Y3B3G7_EURMA|nr:PEHE domain containing protein [Euroglyphus maynei]
MNNDWKNRKQAKINKNKKRRLSTDSVKRSHQRDRLSSGCSSRADSPVPSPSPSDASAGSVSTPTNTSYSSLHTPLNRRRRSEQHAFDINNIVIPYSIAATTRVERLQYKEIVTPKWRLIEKYATQLPESGNVPEQENKNVKNGQTNNPVGEEDISDAAFQIRHLKCEHTERQRILSYYGKNQKNQTIRNKGPQRVRFESSSKSDSLDQTSQDSFHNNTTTHNNSKYKSKSSALNNNDYNNDSSSSARKRHHLLSRNTSRDEVSLMEYWADQQETVSPYEPRKFPLPDWLFEKMVEETNKQQKEMEEQLQRSSRSSAKIDVDYDDSMDADDDKISPPTIEDDDDDADEEIDEDELNNEDDDDDDDNDVDDEEDNEEIVIRTPIKISHQNNKRSLARNNSQIIGGTISHHHSNSSGDLMASEDDPEWKPPPKLS